MNFLNCPRPQILCGWGSILGTIGGIALAGFTGGASIPIGNAIGSAIDSHSAEKKAAKQQVAGTEQANARLDPYNRLGLQSANTLAGLLGMPALPGGGGMGGPMPQQMPQQGINRGVASTVMPAVQQVIANRQMQQPRQGATLAMMRPPSGGAVSSYGGRA